MQIAAIQTAYKGYNFRSRLEARWAVFFDALGINWEYEPEGFELPFVGMYLPDFRVVSPQGLVSWYEVKPKGVSHDAKFDAFKRALPVGVSATLLEGDPATFLDLDSLCDGPVVCPRCGHIGTPDGKVGIWGPAEVFVGCSPCDADTPSGGGNAAEPGLLFPTIPHKGFLILTGAQHSQWRDAVQAAAYLARSARFEHGQKGGRA